MTYLGCKLRRSFSLAGLKEAKIVPNTRCINLCILIERKNIFRLFGYLRWISIPKYIWGGTRWRSWLRNCPTSRKAASSIPDGVTGIFHWHNSSGRTMTLGLGLTQPLTEMSTRSISWGKGGRSVGLTNLQPACVNCLVIWEPQPPGTLRACPDL